MKQTAGQQLLRAHERLKRAQPSYSLRSLSRQLGLAPSFVSDIFRGKRPFPVKHFEKAARVLQMDALAREKLRALLRDELTPAPLRERKGKTFSLPHEEASKKEFPVLARWYFISLADLVTCRGFRPEPDWIAARLGITVTEARQAWQTLVHLKVVHKERGRWKKSSKHLRFPTLFSEPVVRTYHAQLLQKAAAELQKTAQLDFDRRLIAGQSMAVNPDKIPEAKVWLQKVLAEFAAKVSEGPCREVYQLQLQLFPTTTTATEPL